MSDVLETGLAKKNSRSRTHDIYRGMRADILTGKLLPGQKLKISDLCKHFAASLGAVREGLSRLVSEELVTSEAQRGFRVAPISIDELVDLTEMRVDIEGKALRRSIQHGDLNWESRVVASYHLFSKQPLLDDGSQSRMTDAWSEARSDFHQALVSACPSPWLLRLRDMLYDQAERYRRLCVAIAWHDRDIASEQKAVMDAALGREADLAVAQYEGLITRTTRAIIDAETLLP
mgnify:CR=1 FL=1|jgi:DNA-binding GntR family transcriptional regulator